MNLPGPQSKLYLKKGLQYGTNVNDMLWVFSEGAWEELLATVRIMNTIPYAKLTPARIIAGFKAFRGPLILGPPDVACGKVSTGRACRLRQPDPVLQLRGQRQVEGRRDLAEAARSEVDANAMQSAGPVTPGPPTLWTTDRCATNILFAALGLGAGALIASIALGVVLVYRGSGIINVAMGAIAMVAAYLFWALENRVLRLPRSRPCRPSR